MAKQFSCSQHGYNFLTRATRLGDNRQRSFGEILSLCEAEARRRGVPVIPRGRTPGGSGGHGVATTPQALANELAAPITLAENPMEQRSMLAANRMSSFSFGGILGGIGRTIAGFIPGGSTVVGAIDTIRGRGGQIPAPTPRSPVATGPGTLLGCGGGLVKVGNQCIDVTALLPGGRPFATPLPPTGTVAQAPVGVGSSRRAGGFAPQMIQSVRSDCGPRHVLGDDGLCYPKRGFPNKDRMWPRGRAPLLTGGERNAITKAARAARKIERTTKQLQRLGMIKKPNPRRAAPRPRAPLEISPGATRIINVGD